MDLLRVYVAGKFHRYEEVRALIDALPDGCVVTHDWTRTEEFDEDGKPNFSPGEEADIPRDQIMMHAANDIRGVRTADLLILIGDEKLCGALIEVGAAMAYGIPIWVVGPTRWTIFWEIPSVDRFPDVESTLRELNAALELVQTL
jgi:hypothetical protein